MDPVVALLAVPDWVPFAAVVAMAVGVLIVVLVILDRKRTQVLTAFALEGGFLFCGKDWTTAQSKPHLATPLFNQGRSRRFYNIMIGSSSGMPVSLFDYSFTTGGGRQQSTRLQTVAAYSKSGVLFPEFEVHAEGMLEKVGDAIARKDIRFDSHPGFSKTYRLRSPDPEKTRRLFTPGLLSFLEGLDQKKKWRLEGVNDTLIVYRSRKRVKPTDFRTFLEETSAIAGQFFGLCGPTK
jgi:hypothetical protein